MRTYKFKGMHAQIQLEHAFQFHEFNFTVFSNVSTPPRDHVISEECSDMRYVDAHGQHIKRPHAFQVRIHNDAIRNYHVHEPVIPIACGTNAVVQVTTNIVAGTQVPS
mmetsp:Transcript_23306/g.44481  ORF Transcript_23306/g.44481 Transcript_23306/m.44481 type:complete len:108 (-) Transcript_23306:688-1011(-)